MGNEYNKERLKMTIPLYGFYRTMKNASEQHGKKEELMLWSVYQLYVSLPTIGAFTFGIIKGLEALIK